MRLLHKVHGKTEFKNKLILVQKLLESTYIRTFKKFLKNVCYERTVHGFQIFFILKESFNAISLLYAFLHLSCVYLFCYYSIIFIYISSVILTSICITLYMKDLEEFRVDELESRC